MSAPAPWSPMMAPPLPCRNDLEADTCEHAYPRSECNGGWHLDASMRFSEKYRYYSLIVGQPLGLFKANIL